MKPSYAACSFLLSLTFIGLAASVSMGAIPGNETSKVSGVARTVDKSADQSQYVGAQKCAECHAGHFAGWQETGHNKMIRPPTTEGKQATILADFSEPSEFRHFELKDVKWVVGSRWKQRFIGEVNGNDVVFPAQWSITAKKWMPYTAKSDWWWEKHQDWKNRPNFQLCAGCHSTGMDIASESWAELNISCEACHGPGRAHSLSSTANTIVNPARLSTERSLDICLSCHQAGKPNDENFAWPVGYQPGHDLAKYWNPMVPEKGKQTAEFWHNGTAHKNRVQGNTFVQSVMHKHDIQCTNCHDVHSSMHQSMTIKSAASNALCLTCHGPSKDIGPKGASLAAHTHHGDLSTGSRCIECHMPKIAENGVPGEMRNHTFNFISPLATQKTGDPNSCNTCHKDKTSEWALDFVQQWWPKAGPQ